CVTQCSPLLNGVPTTTLLETAGLEMPDWDCRICHTRLETRDLLQCLRQGSSRRRPTRRRPAGRTVGRPCADPGYAVLGAPSAHRSLQPIAFSLVSSLARLRTRSTMARRALASEMRTNALLSSRPSRLRKNCTIAFSAGVSEKPSGTTGEGSLAGASSSKNCTGTPH